MVGGFIGGLIGNKLYNINPAYQPLLAAVCTFIGMIPTAFLINLNPISGDNPSVIYPLILQMILAEDLDHLLLVFLYCNLVDSGDLI